MSDSELDLDLEDSEDAESGMGGFEMPAGFDPSAAMSQLGAGAQDEEDDDVIEEPAADHLDLDLVMDVPVTMEVILGSSTMTVANILKLGRGAVVKLDTKVGEKRLLAKLALSSRSAEQVFKQVIKVCEAAGPQKSCRRDHSLVS